MDRKDGSSTRPLWAEEFSVHGAEDAYVLRRQFTKFLVLTSLGMVTGNAWIWMRSLFAAPHPDYPEAVVANAADVPVGGVKLFSYPTPADPAILVRKPDGGVVAYSQKCTHLSCAVYYSAEHDRLECPCHEGYFAIDTGRVLQGPRRGHSPGSSAKNAQGAIVATGIEVRGDRE